MASWTQQHTWFAIGAGVIIIFLIVFGMSRQQTQIVQAIQKLSNADTMHVRAELVINLPARFRGQERPFTKTIARLDGDMKRTEDRTPEFAGSLYLEARGRGNVFFADGQARILRDRVLFHLDNLPVFLNPSGSLVKRWTKVAVPLMQVKDGDQVRETLRGIMAKATPAGKGPLDEARGKGERLARFTIRLSPEEEQTLADVLRQSTSGSPALHVLARLLDANVVKELLIWTGDGEVRQVRVHFVRPFDSTQGEPQEFDFATLTLTFTDYGKEVTIDTPETKWLVRPEVFGRIFGGGKVEEVKVEGE